MEELYKQLADILDEDKLNSDDILEEFLDWDSLAVLLTISMIDEQFNVIITNEEIKKITTVGDLEKLVKSKMK